MGLLRAYERNYKKEKKKDNGKKKFFIEIFIVLGKKIS